MLLLLLSLIALDEPVALIAHEGFYKPSSLRVNSEGRIFVTDLGEHVLWVFSAQGDLLRTIGGPGQGPGEFQKPTDVGFLPDGRLLVADSGNRRIHLFKADGTFIKMVSIQEQPVGRLLVRDPHHFILSRSNGLSFNFSLGETDLKRFGLYALEGKQVSRFGSYIEHENALLAQLLNDGPMAMLGQKLVFAGSTKNQLIIYDGTSEEHHTYPVRFEPIEPEAKQIEKKDSKGKISIHMSVASDRLCAGLAVIDEHHLLLLRYLSAGEESPVEAVKLNLQGQPQKVYPHKMLAHDLAVSPDGAFAYVFVEAEEGTVVSRFSL